MDSSRHCGKGRTDRFWRLPAEVEGEPAQLVAEALVVEDEIADLVGELAALPLAFRAGRFVSVRCLGCPYGVRGSS
jgi:hypothetical protein